MPPSPCLQRKQEALLKATKGAEAPDGTIEVGFGGWGGWISWGGFKGGWSPVGSEGGEGGGWEGWELAEEVQHSIS